MAPAKAKHDKQTERQADGQRVGLCFGGTTTTIIKGQYQHLHGCNGGVIYPQQITKSIYVDSLYQSNSYSILNSSRERVGYLPYYQTQYMLLRRRPIGYWFHILSPRKLQNRLSKLPRKIQHLVQRQHLALKTYKESLVMVVTVMTMNRLASSL